MKNAYNAVKCSVTWKKVYVSKPLVVVILKCNQKLVGVKSSVCKFFFIGGNVPFNILYLR